MGATNSARDRCTDGVAMSFKRECDGCGALIYDSGIGGNIAPRVEIMAFDNVGDRVRFDEMCMTCWPILVSLIEHQLPMLARKLRALG